MDIVFIRELVVDAVIGVHDWERRVSQRLVLNLELGWDNAAPAAADDLAEAVDYAAVAERVREVVRASSAHLLETLGEELAVEIMTAFGVPWIRLELAKPGAVPGARSVGVMLERGRRA